MDKKFIKQINLALKKYLPKDNLSLSKAMRYSVMAKGKRFRPYLCLEAAKLFTSKLETVIPAACTLEMIHTFTLIHDDLPAMDNSDLRRGKPTCHKVFGEDIALLAGDALNTLAFEIIAKYCDPKKVAQVSADLGNGLIKVVRGQVLDLESEDKKISLKTLKNIHLLKTAALIESSLRIGAILGGASSSDIEALSNYGRHLGLAFQIADDILDVTAKSSDLGKPSGLDAVNKKSTYVSLLGLDKAKKMSYLESQLAVKALNRFGNKAKALVALAGFVVERGK